jgi:S1-C subfamily serine protease
MSALHTAVMSLASLGLSLTLSSTTTEAKEVNRFTSGSWEGAAYVDDKTGEFMFCAASASYDNNIVMSVAGFSDYTWGLLFSADNWRLTPKSELPLRFRIDTSPWFDTKALVIDENVIVVRVAQDTTLYELFRHGRRLQLDDGGMLDFQLTGTSKLMTELGACVTAELGQEPRGAAAQVATKSDTEERRPSSGTGIFVSDSGHILTNDHVINGCGKIQVKRSGDRETEATLVARDASNDLALLVSDLHVDNAETAAFRVRTPVRAGEAIAVYGFPLAGVLSSTGNVVSGNVTALTGLGDDVRYFQISAPIQPGNSGGPLMDYSGLVVGIVNAKLNELAFAKITGDLPQNVNFAIKGNVIASFLDAHSISYRASAPTSKLELPAVTDRAQQFTVIVLCEP